MSEEIEEAATAISEDSRSFYDRINSVYNELDEEIKSDDSSVFDTLENETITESPNPEPEPELEPSRTAAPRGGAEPIQNENQKTTLDQVIDPKTGVVLIDQLMATVGTTTYNMFAKDHKCTPQDWALTSNQMNGLLPVTRNLFESIEVGSDNPWIGFFGVLGGMYIAKAGEVKASYKNGTERAKPADAGKFQGNHKRQSTGKATVRKWVGRVTDRVPNLEHPFWSENPEELKKYQ